MKELVIKTAKKVQNENKTKIEFLVGTMIGYLEQQLKQKILLDMLNFSALGQMI